VERHCILVCGGFSGPARFVPTLFGLVFRLRLICAAYAHRIGSSYSRFDMSISTLENLLKVMREKLPQQDINHTMMLAIDEIIREVKRLDVEIRKAKRTINRRF
jgi:hypothetical protein